jgi:hypothetical protein
LLYLLVQKRRLQGKNCRRGRHADDQYGGRAGLARAGY